ncbi:hypothetical protein [Helicobacter sp. MIT 05-5293]|nr:hypothetical protein [Helicobacter sp. MIT 05-5293]
MMLLVAMLLNPVTHQIRIYHIALAFFNDYLTIIYHFAYINLAIC